MEHLLRGYRTTSNLGESKHARIIVDVSNVQSVAVLDVRSDEFYIITDSADLAGPLNIDIALAQFSLRQILPALMKSIWRRLWITPLR